MPLVVVRYKPDRVPDRVMLALTRALPEIVALALHVGPIRKLTSLSMRFLSIRKRLAASR